MRKDGLSPASDQSRPVLPACGRRWRPFNHVFGVAVALAMVVQLSVAERLSAIVLTFDDITTELAVPVPNGYGGLNWDNMFVVRNDYHLGSGYTNGNVSERYVAFNGTANPVTVFGAVFDFNGAFLTAAWNNGLSVQLIGSREGSELYNETVVVDTTGPTWFQFDFEGIDSLQVSSFGGINAELGGVGPIFVMDNFTYNEQLGFTAVPEPSTYGAFGALALGLLIAARRYRRRRS